MYGIRMVLLRDEAVFDGKEKDTLRCLFPAYFPQLARSAG
uniref:Uncharacterized protein n=1 Tax=Faecalibaculum rodentium TaxID=1702221 RepID=A0A140DSL7_9FIRM|nr:hypothetical protein AALO17_05100 [Faecalibaculum rodentium]